MSKIMKINPSLITKLKDKHYRLFVFHNKDTSKTRLETILDYEDQLEHYTNIAIFLRSEKKWFV